MEFNLEKDVELKPTKDIEELKLAKDVEELKPEKDVEDLKLEKDVQGGVEFKQGCK